MEASSGPFKIAIPPVVRTLVLHDHSVNYLPTEDTFPPEEIFAMTVKFLIDHHSATAITPHN
jgi:hypothetical protein